MGERRQVVRIDQSPMNAKRWCLELDCGHEVWITSTRRPTNKKFLCRHHSHAQQQERK